MYNDVGKKLKTMAENVCILGILISIIAGLVILFFGALSDSDAGVKGIVVVVGICVAGGGSITAWLGSIFTYAFGELVDKTASTYETNCKVLRALEELQQTQEQANALANSGNADVTSESSTSTSVRRRRQLPPI